MHWPGRSSGRSVRIAGDGAVRQGHPWARSRTRCSSSNVDAFRSFPVLVLLVLIFYGLPSALEGMHVSSRYVAANCGLSRVVVDHPGDKSRQGGADNIKARLGHRPPQEPLPQLVVVIVFVASFSARGFGMR
jgi:hypothetical protein